MEKEICQWFKDNLDPTAICPVKFVPEYDIIGKKIGKVEVKEDYLALSTGNYAIEYQNFKGEPSGLALTTADYFVLVDYDKVCFMATSVLKDIVKNYERKKMIFMGGERFGGGRVRGYLIPREKVLQNPMVTVKDRWFPNWDGIGA